MILCPSCHHETADIVDKCCKCNHKLSYIDGFLSWAPEFAVNNDGFNPDSFDILREIEQENFWFKNRNDIFVWAIKKYCGSHGKLLEIGCGTGFVLKNINEAFPNIELTGSEIFSKPLVFTKKRVPMVNLMQMDGRSIPYKNHFDITIAADVLEHIEEDLQTMRELLKSLKPNGFAIKSVPQHKFLWGDADEYACHKRRYAKGELEKKLCEAGFKILRSTSIVSLLFPVMMFSRYKLKNQSKKFNPTEEFSLPKWVNSTLSLISHIERKMIFAGFNFSFGGSRVVIAQKPS